jgi:3-deoxy-manno-octulosonate cytidylyltransferase (CMP-KDO synthetase)
VVIATDDARIQKAAEDFGAHVVMTSASHPSGTDRLAEVAAHCGWPADTIIVNLQGDEPLMPPGLIAQVADDLDRHADAVVSTLCVRIEDEAEIADPHVVKVVMDAAGYALYFSRAAIPWDRDAWADGDIRRVPHTQHFRHIGLYAYRAGFLAEYTALSPSPLERTESLEQLRILWHGRRIHVSQAAEFPHAGVDTEADLRRVAALLG